MRPTSDGWKTLLRIYETTSKQVYVEKGSEIMSDEFNGPLTTQAVRQLIEQRRPVETYEEWATLCQKMMEMGEREVLFEAFWIATRRANFRFQDDLQRFVSLSCARMAFGEEAAAQADNLTPDTEGELAEVLDGIWRRLTPEQKESAELALRKQISDA